MNSAFFGEPTKNFAAANAANSVETGRTRGTRVPSLRVFSPADDAAEVAPLKLSVIIPARNEAPTLPEIVRRVRATALADEIIIVDDGSSDETPALLAALQHAALPALRLLRHPQARGKGAAIRSGLGAASGDIILTQDADLEYDPADYPALLAPFSDERVQAVYGSRNLRANPRSSASFYWGGRLLSWVTNRLYGTQLTDEATGYKVIRAGLLRELRLCEDGFEFCPEVTAKLIRRGVPIHEVPISYRPRTRAAGKKIRWHDGATALWTLLKYRFTTLPGAARSDARTKEA